MNKQVGNLCIVLDPDRALDLGDMQHTLSVLSRMPLVLLSGEKTLFQSSYFGKFLPRAL